MGRAKAPIASKKIRGWCFTLNNYTEDECNEIRELQVRGVCRYVVLGFEVGQAGTRHVQGYIYFTNPCRSNTVRGYLPRAHVEPQRGTCGQAINYCKKDGDFIEFGDAPRSKSEQGLTRKANWNEIVSMARARNWSAILEQYPSLWIRYEQSLRRQGLYTVDTLDHSHRNLWYWGNTGTGKSREARKNSSLYLKKRNKWWDGYDNEECVLIEEWSPELKNTTAQELKIWADIYSFPAEIKGGMIVIRPRQIIITSNYSIEECFDERDVAAIRRRFRVVEFKTL